MVDNGSQRWADLAVFIKRWSANSETINKVMCKDDGQTNRFDSFTRKSFELIQKSGTQ